MLGSAAMDCLTWSSASVVCLVQVGSSKLKRKRARLRLFLVHRVGDDIATGIGRPARGGTAAEQCYGRPCGTQPHPHWSKPTPLALATCQSWNPSSLGLEVASKPAGSGSTVVSEYGPECPCGLEHRQPLSTRGVDVIATGLSDCRQCPVAQNLSKSSHSRCR